MALCSLSPMLSALMKPFSVGCCAIIQAAVFSALGAQ